MSDSSARLQFQAYRRDPAVKFLIDRGLRPWQFGCAYAAAYLSLLGLSFLIYAVSA